MSKSTIPQAVREYMAMIGSKGGAASAGTEAARERARKGGLARAEKLKQGRLSSAGLHPAEATTVPGELPLHVRDVLGSYALCQSRAESVQWGREIVDRILELADVRQRSQGSFLPPSAVCPLCGGISSAPYADGFAYPEGLRRHLTGWGPTQQCEVLAEVTKAAWRHFDQQWAAGEAQARKRAAKELIERRRREVLYVVSPGARPCLRDEDLGYNVKPREPALIGWAEERLATLGFTAALDGRIRTYIDEGDTFIVFADPRIHGRIVFHGFKKPLPTSSSGCRARRCSQFELRDSWRGDVKIRYQELRAEAVARADGFDTLCYR